MGLSFAPARITSADTPTIESERIFLPKPIQSNLLLVLYTWKHHLMGVKHFICTDKTGENLDQKNPITILRANL